MVECIGIPGVLFPDGGFAGILRDLTSLHVGGDGLRALDDPGDGINRFLSRIRIIGNDGVARDQGSSLLNIVFGLLLESRVGIAVATVGIAGAGQGSGGFLGGFPLFLLRCLDLRDGCDHFLNGKVPLRCDVLLKLLILLDLLQIEEGEIGDVCTQ